MEFRVLRAHAPDHLVLPTQGNRLLNRPAADEALMTALPLVRVMGSDANASCQPQRSSCPDRRICGVTSWSSPPKLVDYRRLLEQPASFSSSASAVQQLRAIGGRQAGGMAAHALR